MAPRGGGGKFGGALPKLRILCPKTAFFGTKRPRNLVKTAKGRDTVTIHVRLKFLVTKSPLLPSNSAICPRNGPKMAKIGPKLRAAFVTAPQNQEGALSWATWLKTKFRGHLVHPQTPLLVVFKPQNYPTRHPDPRAISHLAEPESSPACARWGPTVGPPGSLGRKKRFFPKLFPHPMGCSNKFFYSILSPW